jgi:hypothetical protein
VQNSSKLKHWCHHCLTSRDAYLNVFAVIFSVHHHLAEQFHLELSTICGSSRKFSRIRECSAIRLIFYSVFIFCHIKTNIRFQCLSYPLKYVDWQDSAQKIVFAPRCESSDDDECLAIVRAALHSITISNSYGRNRKLDPEARARAA